MSEKLRLLIGTGVDCIISATLDLKTCAFAFDQQGSVIACGGGSTWLQALDSSTFIAVNEHDDKLQLFQRASSTAKWELRKTAPALGSTPCFLSALAPFAYDKAPILLALANYAWNPDVNNRTAHPSFVVFASPSAETLLDKPAFVGKMDGDAAVGPQKCRQESSHPHQAVWDPLCGSMKCCNDVLLLVPDLGTDTVVIARVNRHSGVSSIVNKVKTSPNTGPRHLIFHPHMPSVVYLLGELSCTVSSYDFIRGGCEGGGLPTLNHRDTMSCLPPGKMPFDFGGELKPSNDGGVDPKSCTCATILVSPNGRFLYVSTRGRNSVVGFRLGSRGELLSCIGEFPSCGRIPRFMCFLSDQQHHLLVANQESDSIAVMHWDPETGALTMKSVTTGGTKECPIKSPQCVIQVQ